MVTRVIGYKKIKFYSMENVGHGKINLPDLEMATTAYLFTIPEHILKNCPIHELISSTELWELAKS